MVRFVIYMKLRQSGMENEEFLLVKFHSQADSFQSWLIFQSRLGNIREDLRRKIIQFEIVCRDSDTELQISTYTLQTPNTLSTICQL